MKTKFILTFCLIFAGTIVLMAQSIQSLKDVQPKEAYENIHVIPVHSDDYTSSYVIFIKKEVKLHRHDVHTEHVLILEGKGIMTLNEKTMQVKKGDWLTIPKGTSHSVKVSSRKPMKVVSVQCPKFLGKDRIFMD